MFLSNIELNSKKKKKKKTLKDSWKIPEFLKVYRSDQISHSVVSDSLGPHEPQHARPPCPSPTPGVH